MSKKISKSITAVKGMNDILPADSAAWRRVEAVCQDVLDRHGYAEIRLPIVEQTQLFARSIGAETDIVAKEMYTFEDRNGDSLTLRPEGTASCARSGIQHGLFYNQQQRLWYSGPMFRYERPQKGRYRQFYQLGAEAYGWATPDIEAELISVVDEMFNELGLQKTNLQINSLGDTASRAAFRESLINYLQAFFNDLDPDSQRRLSTNPLRILDSKVERTQEILVDAPSLSDFLNDVSRARFEQLQQHLEYLGIPFIQNSKLVRGLDYYNDTVFEWVNEGFGAQATVCAGGRYDRLVEELGGSSVPAFGFAMGLERLVQILEEQGSAAVRCEPSADIYLISVGEIARGQALKLQKTLSMAGLSSRLHCGEGSIKNQFKRADKSAAKLALIIGEDEAASEAVSIKILVPTSEPKEQQTIAQKGALNVVTNCLESL